jgi:8-oxo-dGTP diphosphatase
MEWNYEQPVVGIGVLVLKNGQALIGQRQADSTHGVGEWAWPGGKLDHMESIVACAKRETLEETGVEIDNVRFLRLMNLRRYQPKHFVDIAMVADWKAGEPEVREPKKMKRWEWRDLDALPEPLFETLPTYLEALRTGQVFWDE